jgi:hypothetical protein
MAPSLAALGGRTTERKGRKGFAKNAKEHPLKDVALLLLTSFVSFA